MFKFVVTALALFVGVALSSCRETPEGDGDADGCGALGQPCCETEPGCSSELSCCSGVPYTYDESGICSDDNCEMDSDRELKQNVEPVSAEEVLARLNEVPISTWSYVDEGASVTHIGPMAQDFYAAFGFGASDRRIGVVDANGVSMASIQALSSRVEDLCDENEELRRQQRELRSEVQALRGQLETR